MRFGCACEGRHKACPCRNFEGEGGGGASAASESITDQPWLCRCHRFARAHPHFWDAPIGAREENRIRIGIKVWPAKGACKERPFRIQAGSRGSVPSRCIVLETAGVEAGQPFAPVCVFNSVWQNCRGQGADMRTSVHMVLWGVSNGET